MRHDSSQNPVPVMIVITQNLPIAEKILLALTAIGLILLYSEGNARLLAWSLLGLGVVLFLYAFRPLASIERAEGELGGFKELLAQTILPKITWIASGVSCLGIALYLFNLGNQGYAQALLTGSTIIAMSLLLICYFALTGTKNIRDTSLIFLRSVPLMIVDFYLLSQLGN